MRAGTRRRYLAIAALLAIGAAACVTIPPPPPPPPWCQSTPGPGANDYGAFVRDKSTHHERVVTFNAATKGDYDQHVAQLKTSNDVVAVGHDEPVHALDVTGWTNNPDYQFQWGFQPGEANFPGAWANHVDGNGVRVGVVDTGSQAVQEDLGPAPGGRVAQGNDFVLTDPSKSNFGTVDGNGHGTHVSGTIAAANNGVGVIGGAPRATIVPARVLDCSGSGSFSAVANGILWESDSTANGGGGAKVISMSLGGSGPPATPDSNDFLHTAIKTAISRGAVVIAAAGNNGPGGQPSYPAAYPEVIAVGAVDQGGAALHLAGDSASTPSSTSVPGNDITSQDLDFVTRVQPDHWRPSTTQVMASKLVPHTSGYEPLALNPDGTLTFTGETGSDQIATSPQLSAVDGTRQWLRVTRSSSDGAVQFFTAPDQGSAPTSWTSPPDAIQLGSAGSVSTPDDALNHLPDNNIEIVARIQPDSWTPTAPQVIASNFDTGGNTGFELTLDHPGTLTLTGTLLPNTGETAQSTAAVGAQDRTRKWVRVTRQDNTVSFFTAPDSSSVPTSWTPLGSPTTNWPSATAFASNPAVPFVVGDRPTTSNPLQGSVLYARLADLATTQRTVVMDAQTPNVGDTQWTGPNGETWTLHASAAARKSSVMLSNASLAPSSVDFTVGERPGDNTTDFHGTVFDAELRNTIGGAAVNKMSPPEGTMGQTSWTASTSETWTLSGSNAALIAGAASYSNNNSYVAVAAPGTHIISTVITGAVYDYLSGTSMATPHVSAVAALIEEKCPGISPDGVRNMIMNSAVGPVVGFGPNVGFLDAGAATNLACLP